MILTVIDAVLLLSLKVSISVAAGHFLILVDFPGQCSCEVLWLVLLPKVLSSMPASMMPRWRLCKLMLLLQL